MRTLQAVLGHDPEIAPIKAGERRLTDAELAFAAFKAIHDTFEPMANAQASTCARWRSSRRRQPRP